MPETRQEQEALRALATTIARSRDDARRLSIPFAYRLLDMCLIEIAMVWQGRESTRCGSQTNDPLNTALETKLRIATAEREADQTKPATK